MIDPRGLTVTEWCDAASHTLVRFGPIPILLTPENWQQWALDLLQLPKLVEFFPPGPRGFTDWRDWVFYFNQAVPY